MFSALGETYLKKLQNAIHVKRYTKDSIVCYEGDQSEYLHILMEGAVKQYKISQRDANTDQPFYCTFSHRRVCLF